jgi:hypothetical protein
MCVHRSLEVTINMNMKAIYMGFKVYVASFEIWYIVKNTWYNLFTERSQDLKQNGKKQTGKAHDPELLMKTMEKTSAIFDRCV